MKLNQRPSSSSRATSRGAGWPLAQVSLAIWLLHAPAIAQQTEAAASPQDEAPQKPAAGKAGDVPLEQVVVTSEKRSSTVLKTPLSVTAVSGDEIADRGATAVNELLRGMPGVAVKGGGPGQSELVMRGLASSGGVSPTVGFYLNEVPITSPSQVSLGHTAIDPDLYDLNRMEVLRGPQGTLYGASSLGGTIRLITAAPNLKRFSGSVEVEASQTEGGGTNASASGMLNIPLAADVSALRLVATRRHDSGWIDRIVVPDFPLPSEPGEVFYGSVRGNPAGIAGSRVIRNVNSVDLTSARAELLFKPAENVSFSPMVFHQRVRQAGADTYDSVPGRSAHYQPLDVAEPYADEFTIGSLTVNWELDDFNLVSASAFSERDILKVQDISESLQNIFFLPGFDTDSGGAGAAVITEHAPTRQFTQEIRLTSKGDGPFSWLLGGFYSRYRSSGNAVSVVPALADIFGTSNLIHLDIRDRLTQTAVFGSGTYQFSPTLRLTAGLRHFTAESIATTVSSGLGSITGTDEVDTNTSSATARGLNPMANLSYSPSSDQMFYLLMAKGFRDGAAQRPVPTTGQNASCATDLADLGLTASPTRFGPDTVWSYEAGSKSRFANGAVTFNLAAFVQNWKDVQQVVGLSCGWGYTDNSGNAQVSGVEYELAARVGGGFTLQHSLGHTRARFSADHAPTNTKKGDRLLGVPEWTASLSLVYDREISEDYWLRARVDGSYTGASDYKTYYRERMPSYSTFNIKAGVEADGWSLSLFVDNLTNTRAAYGNEPQLLVDMPTYDRVATNRPRTAGLVYSARY